ncbi:hypothetical protein CLAIMM_14461 [Cladophialophora immunda]|nr:hypothetical protein CLAIMM_14461 [Cladophialophora immunda]
MHMKLTSAVFWTPSTKTILQFGRYVAFHHYARLGFDFWRLQLCMLIPDRELGSRGDGMQPNRGSRVPPSGNHPGLCRQGDKGPSEDTGLFVRSLVTKTDCPTAPSALRCISPSTQSPEVGRIQG